MMSGPLRRAAFQVSCNELSLSFLVSAYPSQLNQGGVLIYETFAVGNEQFGKPSNPSFLFRRAELFDVVKRESDLCFHILAYEGATSIRRRRQLCNGFA